MKPLAACAILLAACGALAARPLPVSPPTSFEGTGYTVPQPQYPNQARPLLGVTTRPELQQPQANIADALPYLDLVVLAAALAGMTALVLAGRRRAWILVMGLACLAYFGVWKRGCVCPVGAIQNASLALADSGYVVPLVIVGVLVLPVVATLLFGRTFCAGVCPLGMLQDLVLLKPLRVPLWLDRPLRLLPYVYLAAGVLLAATGSMFIICQYDPFVGFFRTAGSALMVLSGSPIESVSTGVAPAMLVLGAAMLVIGMFIGRPYCRWLCPYGAILGHCAQLSLVHAKITPQNCINCRLCEQSCPYGAIQKPATSFGVPRQHGKGALAAMLVLTPVLTVAAVLGGMWLAGGIARIHPDVRLAELLTTAGLEASDPLRVEYEELCAAPDAAGRKEQLAAAAPGLPRRLFAADRLRDAASLADARQRLGAMIRLERSGELWTAMNEVDSFWRQAGDQAPAADAPVGSAQQLRAQAMNRQEQAAADARHRFAILTPIACGFVGAVAGISLICLSIRRRREHWQIDRFACVSCGRCFEACAVEKARRGGKPAPMPAGAGQEP